MAIAWRGARRGLQGLLILAVAGCGHPVFQAPKAQPTKVLRAATREGNAALWVERLATMQANLNTYAANIYFWEQTEKETASHMAEVYTAKPVKLRANIIESSSVMKRGVKVLYLGDKKVTLKIGFIRKTYPYENTKVTSLHDWRIDETDLGALVGDFTDPADVVTDMGPTMVGDIPAQSLKVTGPGVLPGVDEEVMVLDAATASPLHFEALKGGKAVYRLDMKAVKLNPVLPPNTFEL